MRPSRIIEVIVCCVLFSSALFAQSPEPSAHKLTKFLINYVENAGGDPTNTKYVAAYVSLSGAPQNEVIVYLTGSFWCGTGGCTMLVLAPEKDHFILVSTTTISRTPIRVLNSAHNGWHDIGVWVEGGGISPGFEAQLTFNGTTYPGNPSGQQPTKNAPGTTAIADESKAVLLQTP